MNLYIAIALAALILLGSGYIQQRVDQDWHILVLETRLIFIASFAALFIYSLPSDYPHRPAIFTVITLIALGTGYVLAVYRLRASGARCPRGVVSTCKTCNRVNLGNMFSEWRKAGFAGIQEELKRFSIAQAPLLTGLSLAWALYSTLLK